MKTVFVMSVVGVDSPGAIKHIAETTRKCGGEWATSKVMRLEGHLTAMMKVTIDQEKEAELKNELEKQFPDLQFFCSPITPRKDRVTKSISFVVDCKDRPGLTKDLNNVLANLDIVVDNMECSRVHVSSIGETVFSARLVLAVPEEIENEAIADEIESMSDDVRVSVT